MKKDNSGGSPGLDWWTGAGHACALLVKSDGLVRGMRFLLGLLGSILPICRINMGCCQPGNIRMIIPLADTDADGMEFTRIPGPNRPFTLIAESELEKPVLINSLEPYKAAALAMDPSAAGLPFFKHEALLRFPLFTKAGMIHWIDFWSNVPGCFRKTHIVEFGHLLEPLAAELAEILEPGSPALPSSSESVKGSFEMLMSCPALKDLQRKLEKAAPTNATILILGESGAGKEVAARAIHEKSTRAARQFVAVNCGGIAPALLEGELFGAEKGAYTGAAQTRKGYLEYADGGTLFLDEIGELPLEAQKRLLRFLDNRSIQRLGSPRNIPVDCRIVAATNRDLAKMAEEGSFRKDLYYRLSVYPLEIPPLRKRREDIQPLAKAQLKKKAQEYGISPVPTLSADDLARLLAHDWPGNVRELGNLLERALINHERRNSALHLDFEPVNNNAENGGGFPTLEEMEKRHIQEALARSGGRLTGPSGAAAMLGVHYTTLHAKMERYGLCAKKMSLKKFISVHR